MTMWISMVIISGGAASICLIKNIIKYMFSEENSVYRNKKCNVHKLLFNLGAKKINTKRHGPDRATLAQIGRSTEFSREVPFLRVSSFQDLKAGGVAFHLTFFSGDGFFSLRSSLCGSESVCGCVGVYGSSCKP